MATKDLYHVVFVPCMYQELPKGIVKSVGVRGGRAKEDQCRNMNLAYCTHFVDKFLISNEKTIIYTQRTLFSPELLKNPMKFKCVA